MWSLGILLTTLVHFSLASHVPRSHHDSRALPIHNLISAANVADTYDFVICGGGVAGLVIANRLSEDPNVSVLVLEAGGTGEDVADSIDVPSNAYFNSLLSTESDWNYRTVNQPKAGGGTLTWPRGKVLGGSSAINGMYLVRPSEIELDAWSGMIASQDDASAAAWNWNWMYAAMKKTETFHAPSDKIKATGDIKYDVSAHGTDGPLHYGYPGFMLPTVGSWSPTLQAVGIPTSPNPSAGQTWGSFVATSSINPSNWTRSYARSAYLDPLPPRSNLAVLTGSTVTRLIFSGDSSQGNLVATQVEYASAAGAPKKTVKVGKEAILTGGAVGSPQILMLSGVGPQDVLKAAKVNMKLNLPGVGHHLQDHLASAVIWSTNADTDASEYSNKFDANAPGSSSAFLSFVNSATAYVNISTLLGADAVADFQKQITDALDTSASTIVPSKDSTVLEGYKAIYNVNANQFMNGPIGQIELLLGLTGTMQAGDQSIAIQAALQHPFSQGQIYITSSDPFDVPAINPNYLSHFADKVMLREGLKLARKIGQTAPLNKVINEEVLPGSEVNTDEEWEDWLSGQVATEYHPTGTCSMLPKSQGGVVDANMRVYGIGNVRVADSSVYPIEFSAHLQAPTYALAEQAAVIIKSQYNGVPPPWAPATTASSSVSGSATSSPSKNGAESTGRARSAIVAVFCAMVVAALTMLLY